MRALFLFFILAAAAVTAACSSSNAVTDLGPSEFASLIEDENVFLLDVHVPEQEHINGTDAVIPYNELTKAAEKLPADKNTGIAVYCRSGSMSAEAAETLKSMGYTKVYNLEGGMNAWKERAAEKPRITLMKSASCGCCGLYSSYIKSKGFDVENVNVKDMAQVKRRHNIPGSMESCHTMVVGKYFVEGHVPVEAIDKLLAEQPEVDGIALPGMPEGSPGMTGAKQGQFVVYSLKEGKAQEFMRV